MGIWRRMIAVLTVGEFLKNFSYFAEWQTNKHFISWSFHGWPQPIICLRLILSSCIVSSRTIWLHVLFHCIHSISSLLFLLAVNSNPSILPLMTFAVPPTVHVSIWPLWLCLQNISFPSPSSPSIQLSTGKLSTQQQKQKDPVVNVCFYVASRFQSCSACPFLLCQQIRLCRYSQNNYLTAKKLSFFRGARLSQVHCKNKKKKGTLKKKKKAEPFHKVPPFSDQ